MLQRGESGAVKGARGEEGEEKGTQVKRVVPEEDKLSRVGRGPKLATVPVDRYQGLWRGKVRRLCFCCTSTR